MGCLSRNRRETGIVAIAFSGRKAAMTSDKSPRQRSSRLVEGPGVGARWRACVAIIDGALFKDRSRWLCLLALAPLVALQGSQAREKDSAASVFSPLAASYCVHGPP